MALGHKNTFTGIVRRQRIGVGSHFEHDAVVLDMGHDGPPLLLRFKDGNPFNETVFDIFVGKRVSIAGVSGSGLPFIMIDNVADITVLGPPGRPNRPPQP